MCPNTLIKTKSYNKAVNCAMRLRIETNISYNVRELCLRNQRGYIISGLNIILCSNHKTRYMQFCHQNHIEF